MATPSPEPDPRTWENLVSSSRLQPVPAIDVRGGVRAALMAESSIEEAPPVWSEGLLEIFRLPWMRVLFATGVAAAVALCASGWWSLSREISDPIAVALQEDASMAFANFAP